MSKSLKNFITIDASHPTFTLRLDHYLASDFQEILQRYSARQLRLAFITQLWNAKTDFSDSLMTGEVKTIESNINVRRMRYYCYLD
jgi:cysteinyl-tRNA synthetase